MAFPDVVFSGKIYSVLDRESKTMKVRVNLDNTGEMLRPGLFASVRVSLSGNGRCVPAVPSSAVIYFNYLEEKAHALAEEKFSEDELDAVKYRNVVIRRQNSISTSKEMFINVADRVAAEKQLMQYLDRGEIERLFANQTIKFEEKQEVGIASVVIIIDSSRLIIEGQGIGIPESDLAHIFQPFYRASNVGAVSGKGVGLALSKSILQRMGATIAVISSIDSCTTFTITFPS